MIPYLVSLSDRSQIIVIASDIHSALAQASVKEVGDLVIVGVAVTPYSCL